MSCINASIKKSDNSIMKMVSWGHRASYQGRIRVRKDVIQTLRSLHHSVFAILMSISTSAENQPASSTEKRLSTINVACALQSHLLPADGSSMSVKMHSDFVTGKAD